MRGFGVPVCEWPSSCLLFSLLFFPCTRSGGKNLIILLFAESNRKRPLVYFCSLGLSLKQILDSQLQSARDPGFLESVIPPGPVCTHPPQGVISLGPPVRPYSDSDGILSVWLSWQGFCAPPPKLSSLDLAWVSQSAQSRLPDGCLLS